MIMYSAIAGGCRKRLRFCLVFSPYAISNHCLRGCDAGSAAAPSTQRDFNPRAHEGRDSRTALVPGNPFVQTLHIGSRSYA